MSLSTTRNTIIMKLKEVREQTKYYSQKVSETNQKLALAGIALIWLFKETSDGVITFTPGLIISLLFFILSITVDILQYISFSSVWSNYYNIKYKALKAEKKYITQIENEEVGQPWKSNLYNWLLFYLKILLMFLGYIILAFIVKDIIVFK